MLLGSIKELIWKANLQMKWPEEFEVEGIARRKTDAINICYLLACHKLKVCCSFHFTYLEKYFPISFFLRTFNKDMGGFWIDSSTRVRNYINLILIKMAKCIFWQGRQIFRKFLKYCKLKRIYQTVSYFCNISTTLCFIVHKIFLCSIYHS